jgi:iodotyrosine deiodinase
MRLTDSNFIDYARPVIGADELIRRSSDFYGFMHERRSVRDFSPRPVPSEVIENILKAAATAPSGANKQPWTFCVISNAALKRQIRSKAEDEEFISYNGGMNDKCLQDLEPFGTNHTKQFIETSPYIIVVFKKAYDVDEQGRRHNNYYVNESVGIAVGMLLAAIHHAGLAALTHTPSPMNFIHEILERPDNEQPYLLIPVGYPAETAKVPNVKRKQLSEVAVFYH